jgi:two-component system response regulator DctR
MATLRSMIHIVDDEEPIRDALAWLLKSHRYDCRQHASAEAFLADIATRADQCVGAGCVVLDIRMPGVHGDAVFDRMRKENLCPAWPVIFLTGHGDIAMAVETLKAGAFDFVEKPFNDASFIQRVEAALAESQRRLQRAHEIASVKLRLATLTPREREVMDLVVAGHYNKVIADRLGIVPRTVEFFRARIFEKMGVKSAIELASLLASRDRLNGR